MEFTLPILYLIFFLYLVWKIKFFDPEGLTKKIIVLAFLLKVIAGFALWAIYTFHYTYRNTSDAYRFFDDAMVIFNATKDQPLDFLQIITGINADSDQVKACLAETNHWYRQYDYGLLNDDRTLIRFNALVLFFSFGYYHVHTLFMNFLSLIGLVALFRTFSPLLPQRKTELAAAVFLIPTVVFWGSGVLKEGLILFALGLFCYSFYGLLNTKANTKNLLALAGSLLLLVLVKMYVLVCLIPGVVSVLVVKASGNKFILLKFTAIHLVLILAALNLHRVFPDYNILEILQTKQKDFYNVAELWNAGSAIDIGRLEPTLISFIKNIPQALTNTFLRPHIFEADSAFLWAAAFENLLILGLAIYYLLHFRKPGTEKKTWLWLCLSFVVFLALIIGWTTPIMGAVVRYKLPLLPFLFFILFFISDKPKPVSKIESWIKLH